MENKLVEKKLSLFGNKKEADDTPDQTNRNGPGALEDIIEHSEEKSPSNPHK